MTGTVAITMAGMGSRFLKAGYERPKYEILACGRPLFDWSMLSLTAFRDAGWRFHFIAREGLDAPRFITERAAALGLTDITIDCISELTDGQATTALLAAETAPADQPFAIYNIDTFVSPDAMKPPQQETCAGWIPCFPGPGDAWSFARLDSAGDVIEVREKVRISEHATVGLYWFDSSTRYVALYSNYFSVPGREEKGERYVAPLYNALIEDKLRVRISDLKLSDIGMLGTPDQVDTFIADPPPSVLGFLQSQR